MTKLYYAVAPAYKASWTIPLYHKSVRVTNGEVETDDKNVVDQLYALGFRELVEDEPIG